MNITRKEAITILQHLAEIIPSGDYQETFKMAVSALRPVSRERVKRKADARALVPCPGCGGENIVDCYRHNEVWYQCDDCGWQGPSVYSEGFADTEKARLAWNTRAPILSKSEMEMLEGME